jgi:beta-lactamase regulating signal transducer with metallopeptidase domain
MNAELWLENLIAYSVQIAALVTAASLLARLLRLRNPGVLYRGWQLVLVLAVAGPLLQPWREASLSRPAAAPGGVNSALEAAGPDIDLAAVALAVIGCGALLRLARLGLGLVQLGRLRRSGRKLRRLPEDLSELRSRLGLDVDLYLSGEVDGAVSLGVYRPVILLPDAFAVMDAPARMAVLCHELLHVRRRDWVFALAEEIIRSLFWFHPAVWWAVERIQLAREQVVDRAVIEIVGERDPYLEALLHTAALRACGSGLP